MQQDDDSTPVTLSAIWLELLGRTAPTDEVVGGGTIPALESDPWSHLLHAQGTEVVDPHKVSLHMSDQEVEQLLQQLREQHTTD